MGVQILPLAQICKYCKKEIRYTWLNAFTPLWIDENGEYFCRNSRWSNRKHKPKGLKNYKN